MKPTCRTVSTGLVGTVAVPVSARSAAIAERMRNCENSSEAPPPHAATMPTGASEGLNIWPPIRGVSAVSVLQSPITRSPSKRPSREAGPGNRFTRMATSFLAASAAIPNVLRAIKAAGLGKTLRALFAKTRTHKGGGTTILPHGHAWRRHEGTRARARRLKQESRQIHQRSRADLDDLERRYRQLLERQ